MPPFQEDQRRPKLKTFLRKLLPSKPVSSSLHASAHDSLPSINSSRPTSISPGHVFSNTDPVASTLRSALDPTGPDSWSFMIQATGTVTSRSLPQMVDHVELERTIMSDTPLSPAAGSTDLASLAGSDRINRHDQLLKKIEPCLSGTPAKVPVNVLNTIIDIGKAIVNNKSAIGQRIIQTMDCLNIVNDALLKSESDGDVELAMRAFAGKLVDEAVMLKGLSSSRIWEKIIENEEDAKKIEGSFKRIDEYTKDFELEIILRIERNTSDLSNARELLDELYQQVLREAFSNLENELFHMRLSILHTFLCTEERVSPPIVAALISDMGVEDKASVIVDELHAVLYANEGRIF
ncbi:hypothetical protein AX14_003019 [Amanita brunnescens Koide BX004]|nr:hypothetical protein AX14_003019 [Amanita brunnescens Koide BX004]